MAATLLSGGARFTNGPLCNVPGRPGNIDYRTLQMPNAKLNERGSDHGNGFGFRCRCKTLLHKPSDLVGQIGDGPAKRRWGKQPIMPHNSADFTGIERRCHWTTHGVWWRATASVHNTFRLNGAGVG